jgi:hypothetical protein
MRDIYRVKLVGVVALVALGLYDAPNAEQRSAPMSPPEPVPVEIASMAPSATIPPQFAGTWDYNAQESINILTGRPEQAPRSATQGGRAAGPPVRVGGGQGTGGGGRGAGSFGGASGFGGTPPSNGLGLGPTPEMMREQRDMSRDLLEVPETYKIALAATEITFVDDIERERTYTIGGRKQKYRLGASEFSARVEWTGTQLRKEIEGTLGFRMTETYFLSPDGQRLFVMIRVGQANRNRQPSGYNRVYDRVDPAPAESARAN